MFKHFILFTLFACSLGAADAKPLLTSRGRSAESGSTFYIKAGAGYNFKFLSDNGHIYTHKTSGQTTENKSFSLGSGFRPEISFGLNITENIGIELNASYLLGASQNPYEEHYETNSSGTAIETFKGSMFCLTPMFVIKGSGEIKPYAMAGPMFGLFPKILINETYEYDPGKEDHFALQLDGGMALGVKAAAGVEFAISSNLSIYGEAVFIAMSYAPTLGTVTAETQSGVDQDLSKRDTRDIKTEYVDSYDDRTTIPKDEPSKQLKIYLPFSSIGLNLGVKLNF